MKDRLRKVQFKYLDYLFENTYGVKSKNYPNSTFFKKDDKVILELEKSGTLWVLYSVWNSISDTFSIQYEETKQLIKEWMESQLKLGEVAPSRDAEEYCIEVESQLKQEEVTPIPSWLVMKQKVESQLKNEEVTPLDAGNNYLPFIEKQLKQEEITPHKSKTRFQHLAEERLKSWGVSVTVKGHLADVEEQLELEEVKPHLLAQGWSEKVKEELKKEEVTPKEALPPYSWTNLKSEKVTQ